MRNILYFFLQGTYLFRLHILADKHRECAGAEILLEDILPFHRVDLFRKVCQKIVIDLCTDIAKHGRNQQYQRYDQDHHSLFYNQ